MMELTQNFLKENMSSSYKSENSVLKFDNSKKKRLHCINKCCMITVIIILLLLILIFLVVFVGFPLLFMNSITVQRMLLFEPTSDIPELFTDVYKYIPGSRNLYVTVNLHKNISLGIWHVLPKALINDSNTTKTFNFINALNKSDYPILLHFHGNAGNRIRNLPVYLELRHYFHIIAFDYRGYGDSSNAELTEEGLIEDSVQLYQWLQLQTTADIFVWGHSMGTAVATHTVAKLHDLNIVPAGLTLEAPYTTLEEEVIHYPLAKIHIWLPWFNKTILKPMWKNGFHFETSRHILKVDCPVMILHAKDDNIIPYFLGEKLYRIAKEKRNITVQGDITLYLFSEDNHYEHWGIYKSPLLPKYIRKHIDEGRNFTKRITTLKDS